MSKKNPERVEGSYSGEPDEVILRWSRPSSVHRRVTKEGWARTVGSIDMKQKGAKRFCGSYLQEGETRVEPGTLILEATPFWNGYIWWTGVLLHRVDVDPDKPRFGILTRLGEAEHWSLARHLESLTDFVQQHIDVRKERYGH